MKNKKFLIVLTVAAMMGLLPFLFAAEAAAAAEQTNKVPAFVKFICAITFQDPGNPADFVVFLGRFHPLVLHMPIGVLVVSFIMEFFSIWKKKDLNLSILFALGFGSASAWLAVFLGALLSTTNNYPDADLINRHGWLGMLFAASFTVAFVVKYRGYVKDHEKMSKKPEIIAMAVSLTIMSIVGHDGGSLTHGPEYLFDHAPDWVRGLTGREPKDRGIVDPEGTVYKELVARFMKQNCISCHSDTKAEGKIKLHSMEAIKASGDDLIVIGDADSSLLYEVISTDDEDFIMPPKGKLSDNNKLEMIKWWINSSKSEADLYERKVKDAVVPEAFMDLFIKGKKKSSSEPPPHAKSGTTESEPEGKASSSETKPEEKTEDKAASNETKPEEKTELAKGDFAKHIQPILEARCIKCHGEKKQKGEYRIDKAEFAFTAGESEKAPIVKGKPEESYLVTLIKLSEDDDDVMPPKGGNLTKEQIAAIEKWIKEGAEFPSAAALQDKSK